MGCSPWGSLRVSPTERLHFHFSLSCIGEGTGNPLQCSCLENPRDRGAWWAAVYGVAQSQTRLKWLSSSSPPDQLCPALCDPMDGSLPHSCPWDSPGKNAGGGCHALLQKSFLTQGTNPASPACRQILYHCRTLASSGYLASICPSSNMALYSNLISSSFKSPSSTVDPWATSIQIFQLLNPAGLQDPWLDESQDSEQQTWRADWRLNKLGLDYWLCRGLAPQPPCGSKVQWYSILLCSTVLS